MNYERAHQPRPKLGPWQDELEQQLSANEAKPHRDRQTLIRIFEELREQGFKGGYESYAWNWVTTA